MLAHPKFGHWLPTANFEQKVISNPLSLSVHFLNFDRSNSSVRPFLEKKEMRAWIGSAPLYVKKTALNLPQEMAAGLLMSA